MHIRCPHCQNPVEVVDDDPRADLTCPSCGSSFSLISTASTLPPRPGERMLGRFELLEQVGIGQFGMVWKARDTELDRTVALKIPRRGQLDGAEAEQFLREARAAAQLRHPHIVSTHEVGRVDETIFIVSDFVKGANLSEWLTGQRLTAREAAELCVQVAEALHHAHEAGVIHRDLKPSNIMIDADGQPHIMDFGLAKRETGKITMTREGHVLGTPAYMSPEQAGGEGHTADRRSDIYSLGVILFELLTGERPFRGDERMLIVQILGSQPPSPRRLNSHIPRDLETICLKCLEKAPDKRYQTAQAAADDLRRWLKGEPIQARPVGKLECGWRWIRRRPAVAALLLMSAVTLLCLGGIVVGLRYQARLQAAFAAEQSQREKAERAQEAEAEERNRAESAREQALKGQQMAKAAQIRAEAAQQSEAKAKDQLDQVLYLRRVSLAAWEWRNDDVGRAVNLLSECPEQRRHWEWHYVNRLCHSELVTFRSPGPTGCVAFSPDGRRLAGASMRDNNVRVWDRETDEILRTLEGHNKRVSSLTFSPDGRRLAAASADGTVVWSLETGEEVQRSTRLAPVATELNGKPKFQAAVLKDKTVRIWNRESGNEVHTWSGHDGEVSSVAVSPDGKRVAVTCMDRPVVTIYDVAPSRIRTLKGHFLQVLDAAFSADNRFLATASGDGVKLWAADTEQEFVTLPKHSVFQFLLSFGRNDHEIVTIVADETAKAPAVTFYDLETRLSTRRTSLEGKWDDLASQTLSFASTISPDLKHVAGYRDSKLRVWDAETGREVHRIEEHGGGFSLLFSPDGTQLAGDGQGVYLWDVATGKEILKLDAEKNFTHVAFSPDGKQIAAASRDHTVSIWETETGRELIRLPRQTQTGIVEDLVFSPDGRFLATFTEFAALTLWNAKTGQQLWRVGTGGASGPGNGMIAFTPDGLRLAATSGNDVRLWDVETGQEALTLKGHADKVTRIVFSRNGRRLATGIFGGGLRIWDAGPAVAEKVFGRSTASPPVTNENR